ncbi:type II toxin-antitoxin system HipA family toxin [Bifidobacterium aerophilum]|uniref:Type II toxin-antitoxin system HipA family toxin n=1 Tax=Bifidobacterium aerophilum TaxID=1798155 RepID=A0A6N9Z755_9BIFI|nr:type II toxin-antitoxin system HipA family toxin [Bifidobacterium aerophilum]NEG89955.1 type II toxin-antitoxin system HipA family toxin [Bifidobacterium aerophilum]
MTKPKTLDVLLEGRHIGTLREERSGKHTFTYDMDSSSSAQLSLSMPRRMAPWEGAPVEAYIDGILPDALVVRQRIARMYGVNAHNPFSLLTAVGLDCGGGVQFVAPDDNGNLILDETVRPLNSTQIAQRLHRISGTQQASWQSMGEHWSLNGAHDKIALRFISGQWYEVEGAAATTHIIKPGIHELHEQAFNEYLCMKTAEHLSIPVAQTDYQVFDDIPALVSARWDRVVDDRPTPALVRRLHQEDLCQAMSIMTAQKYQAEGGPDAVEIIRFLRANGFANDDVHFFIRALVFNYLIAGSDAHAKNYAILEPAGERPRLAPLYDIASLFPYATQRKDRKLAMSIGGEYSWERIDLRHWQRFADTLGGPSDREIVFDTLIDLATRTVPAFLQASVEALSKTTSLPSATDESQKNKGIIATRIQSGIIGQCTRVLKWFSVKGGS